MTTEHAAAADTQGAVMVSGRTRFEAEVPIERLKESSNNPRQRFDAEAMRELQQSIAEKGVLTPLLVRPDPDYLDDAWYEIASGHRRFRAAKAAGLKTVPVIVRDMTDEEFLEVLVIENDQREDVHALEEASGYQALLQLKGYDVAKIAARVGRSPKYVYDRLKLLHLVPAAQKLFLEDRFTAGHAILLARLKPEDQERAIQVDGDMRYGRADGMFVSARSLPFDEDEVERLEKEDPYALVKPVSVREFEAWIQRNVRFDREQIDPMLFPETADMIEAAEEAEGGKLRLLLVTRDYRASDEVRGAGKDKVLGENSWYRADGKDGSKACDHARYALVAAGPGQGEGLKVCIAKEKCAVHWSAWQKERAKRQAASEEGGDKPKRSDASEERWKIEARQRREEQERYEAERKRWDKARPQLLAALAEKVKAAPTKAGGLLASIVIQTVEDAYGGIGKAAAKYMPAGKSADDVVRAAAFMVLTREVHSYRVADELPKRFRAFGLDARKIVDQVAPPEPTVQTSAKSAGKKKARR